jgi:hypothetical protein
MTKEQILEVLKLLSALEAWSFSNCQRLPDYLLEDLDKTIEVLTVKVLE